MFATIRARRPYGEHLPYAFVGNFVELVGARPIAEADYRDFDYTYRALVDARRADQLDAKLATVLADARAKYPAWDVRGVRVWTAIYEAPAYPAPARLERRPIAVIGEYRADGTFRSLLGAPARATHLEARLPVVDGDPLYLVDVVDATPWLVATLPRARTN
jgi:hypothetical protein